MRATNERAHHRRPPQSNDKQQAQPRLTQVLVNTEQVPRTVSMNAGYFSEANVTACTALGCWPLIPLDRQLHSQTVTMALRGRLPVVNVNARARHCGHWAEAGRRSGKPKGRRRSQGIRLWACEYWINWKDQPALRSMSDRLLAYQLFCECGCAHGQDVEYRLEAERRVLEKYRRSRTTRRLLCRVRYPVSCDSRAEG